MIIYTQARKGSVPVKCKVKEIYFSSDFDVPNLEVKAYGQINADNLNLRDIYLNNICVIPTFNNVMMEPKC